MRELHPSWILSNTLTFGRRKRHMDGIPKSESFRKVQDVVLAKKKNKDTDVFVDVFVQSWERDRTRIFQGYLDNMYGIWLGNSVTCQVLSSSCEINYFVHSSSVNTLSQSGIHGYEAHSGNTHGALYTHPHLGATEGCHPPEVGGNLWTRRKLTQAQGEDKISHKGLKPSSGLTLELFIEFKDCNYKTSTGLTFFPSQGTTNINVPPDTALVLKL